MIRAHFSDSKSWENRYIQQCNGILAVGVIFDYNSLYHDFNLWPKLRHFTACLLFFFVKNWLKKNILNTEIGGASPVLCSIIVHMMLKKDILGRL